MKTFLPANPLRLLIVGCLLAAAGPASALAQAPPQPHAVFTIVRPWDVGPPELSNAPLTIAPIQWNPPTAWIDVPSPLNNNLLVKTWLEPPPLVVTFDHSPAADWGQFTSAADGAMAPDAQMSQYDGATNGSLYDRNNNLGQSAASPISSGQASPYQTPLVAPGGTRRKPLGW